VPTRLEVAVPWERLPGLYREMTLFAMPCRSRWFGLEVEGLGLVFLEAAAAGLPVLAGDSGGSPETVVPGETGYIVADDEALDEGIRLLLDDPAGPGKWAGRAGSGSWPSTRGRRWRGASPRASPPRSRATGRAGVLTSGGRLGHPLAVPPSAGGLLPRLRFPCHPSWSSSNRPPRPAPSAGSSAAASWSSRRSATCATCPRTPRSPAELKGEDWARLGSTSTTASSPCTWSPSPSGRRSPSCAACSRRRTSSTWRPTRIARGVDRLASARGAAPRVPVRRLVFHEITAGAIRQALAQPATSTGCWSMPRKPAASSTASSL